MKIINLSTALETILSDKSEGLKGAQLSARMLILFIMMKKRFSNPIRLLKIYEIRSDIIHGTDLGISNRHEYITILRITIDTLLNSIELIKTRKIKNHKEFIYTIEHSPEKEIALKFLEEQGDEMSADIKKFIEEMK